MQVAASSSSEHLQQQAEKARRDRNRHWACVLLVAAALYLTDVVRQVLS